ncbi:MAG: SDR family oxidoreductase [Chitinophagaceae bacterium]|nr:MAG: SDR family oxidoreductase [Chitinophagaceae bacterium]
MDLSLTGRTALVCGSTQGIGKAIAMEFAAAGATVILIARNKDSLMKTLGELDNSHGQEHQYLVADFGEPHSVKQAVEHFITGKTVHLLVNNTGGPAPGPITDSEPENFTKAFNQHIVNNQQLVQLLLPGMRSAEYGRIINIVSTSVKIPIANLGVSNTIRAATAGWAKTLSLEVAKDGITVNNILPGYTETGRLDSLLKTNSEKQQVTPEELAEKMKMQIPARRFGKPEEIAAVAAFLASPAASYVNGTSIPVDGGSTGAF